MGTTISQTAIESIIAYIEKLIPKHVSNPADKEVAHGNVAICIIDFHGNIFGRMYGDDKIRCRRSYHLAWVKASQVWITGYSTGDFERKIFNNELTEEQFGISKPDLIGWEGGQVITLSTGENVAVGFSGFRGLTDLTIVQNANQTTLL